MKLYDFGIIILCIVMLAIPCIHRAAVEKRERNAVQVEQAQQDKIEPCVQRIEIRVYGSTQALKYFTYWNDVTVSHKNIEVIYE